MRVREATSPDGSNLQVHSEGLEQVRYILRAKEIPIYEVGSVITVHKNRKTLFSGYVEVSTPTFLQVRNHFYEL